jgi:hypothetical protein
MQALVELRVGKARVVKSGYTLDSVVSASLGRGCDGEQLVAAERMRQQGKHNVGQSAGQHHGDEGPVAGGRGVGCREWMI